MLSHVLGAWDFGTRTVASCAPHHLRNILLYIDCILSVKIFCGFEFDWNICLTGYHIYIINMVNILFKLNFFIFQNAFIAIVFSHIADGNATS